MLVYYAKMVKLNLRAVVHWHVLLVSGVIKLMKEVLFSACGHVRLATPLLEI